MEKPKDVLNINELASYLDIPKSTIYKLVREGKIPAQKVDRHQPEVSKPQVQGSTGGRHRFLQKDAQAPRQQASRSMRRPARRHHAALWNDEC
jgi:excisionase family DNA binding protein